MVPIYDNNLPDGWESEELRNATLRKRGYSWSKEDETDRPEETTVPVLRIPNIQDKLDLENLLYLRNVSDESLRESAVSKDWILFVGSNGNPDRIGDSALMTVDRPMVFASFLMALASKDTEQITPEFLSAWLRLHNVHEAFSKTSQQTTGLANFSWSAVKRLPIRFPKNRQEQEAITHILNVADDSIAAAEAKLTAARRLKTALMQQLFTRGIPGRHGRFQQTKIGEVPERWDLPQLRQLFRSSTNGLYVPDAEYGSGTPIIRIDTFEDGDFYSRDFDRVRISDREIDLFEVKNGDVLFNRVNSIPFVGKVVFVDGLVERTVFESNMMRLRFDDVELAQYVALALCEPSTKRRIWSMARPAIGQLSINQRELGHSLLPCRKRVNEKKSSRSSKQ